MWPVWDVVGPVDVHEEGHALVMLLAAAGDVAHELTLVAADVVAQTPCGRVGVVEVALLRAGSVDAWDRELLLGGWSGTRQHREDRRYGESCELHID